ncbi:MAG: PIN domain-containing protein [Solobacterium sp.]|nr:PIN domain-containing protein [Solobacterium sp.]
MTVMMDTCIILDYLPDRETFADDAEKLILMAAEGEIDGMVTVKSLMDIHYVLKHVLLDEKKTRESLHVLLDSLIPADSASEDAVRALSSKMNDYEDALMSETAKAYHCECIITGNTKDYRSSPVPAVTPSVFLKRVSGTADYPHL